MLTSESLSLLQGGKKELQPVWNCDRLREFRKDQPTASSRITNILNRTRGGI